MSTDAAPVPANTVTVIDTPERGPWWGSLTGVPRLLAAFLGAFALFAIVIWSKGANPFTAYKDMFHSSFGSTRAIGEVFLKATPIILAGLAVTVPARAGLINVGGEGQLLVGGLAAMGTSLALGDRVPGPLALVLMALAAALAGATWAAIAGVLRQTVGIAESVSTLLLNYIALDLMFFLIYDRWKDRNGSGQPATRPLPSDQHLPLIGSSRVHIGIFLAIGAALVVFVLFRSTTWGFRLRVVGGNPEAARRSGLKVGALLISAIAVGGALGGLGGFAQLAGAEFKLRSGFLVTYGYVGFLASWLGRHRPVNVVVSALLLSAVSIGGDSLQIDSKLPAATVNILMALILLMVFGFGTKREKAA